MLLLRKLPCKICIMRICIYCLRNWKESFRRYFLNVSPGSHESCFDFFLTYKITKVLKTLSNQVCWEHLSLFNFCLCFKAGKYKTEGRIWCCSWKFAQILRVKQNMTYFSIIIHSSMFHWWPKAHFCHLHVQL